MSKGNLFLRDDTFFGVCEGLGEDFGIPSNLFRIAFAAGLFFSPLGAIAVYLGLGLILAVSHWLVPLPRPVARNDNEALAVAHDAPEHSEESDSLQIAA